LLGALLAFGSLAPPLALAKHGDTEGEGTSSPGEIPGLEIGVGNELGGEETPLSEEPVDTEESEIEEEVPAPEIEEAEPEAPAPPATEPEPSPETEVVVPVEEVSPPKVSEPAPAPSAGAPSYGVEGSPPSYEPSPGASPPDNQAGVENEAIAAPASPPVTRAKKAMDGRSAASLEVVAQPESDPVPSVPAAPEPSPTPPAVMPAAAPDRAGSLTGKKSHRVAAGECLWVIAERYLLRGASNSEIAAEVHHLWRLNAASIGTGDPDLLPIGVKLRFA
jgi:hypothetical protein